MRTKLFNAIKVSTLALVLSFGLSFVYAWTAPTVTAPNGNVSAPINTSSTAQTKAGAFTVGSLITAGSATVGSLNAGSGSISTTGTLATGAATVGSLSAGSGSISTTGTLTSGPATVGSLDAGAGNIFGYNLFAANSLTVTGTTTTSGLKVANGTAGFGKVLTSDASGNASWQASGGSHGIQIFTTAGAGTCPSATNCFSVPAGVTQVLVSGIGGGGGGAGANVWNSNPCQSNGLGGTAGASVVLMPINVAPLANIPVTIGAGGLGGVGAGPCPFGYGGTGGQTLFGTYSIPGGPGGGKGGPGDGGSGWQGLSGGLGSKTYPSAPTAVPVGHYGAGGGGGGFVGTSYAYSGTPGYQGLLIVQW